MITSQPLTPEQMIHKAREYIVFIPSWLNVSQTDTIAVRVWEKTGEAYGIGFDKDETSLRDRLRHRNFDGSIIVYSTVKNALNQIRSSREVIA